MLDKLPQLETIGVVSPKNKEGVTMPSVRSPFSMGARASLGDGATKGANAKKGPLSPGNGS